MLTVSIAKHFCKTCLLPPTFRDGCFILAELSHTFLSKLKTNVFPPFFLCDGAPKNWFVIESLFLNDLEDFVSTEVLSNEYHNNCFGRAQALLGTKRHFVQSKKFVQTSFTGQNFKNFAKKRTFCDSCYMGYNVTKATSFADSSWLEIGMVMMKNGERKCSHSQCNIPAGRIVWMETIDALSSQTSTRDLNNTLLLLPKNLFTFLSNFVKVAKREIAHFDFNDSGNVQIKDKHIAENNKFICL